MTDDANQEPPPRPNPQLQQVLRGWLDGPHWDQPFLRRNNTLLDSQPSFVPPPPAQQSLSAATKAMVTAGGELTLTPSAPVNQDIEARFQEALRRAADLTSYIDQLRKASRTREIGPGHNQGPPLEDLVWVDAFIELLKDEGPRIKTAADAKHLIEQTEKVKQLPDRIWTWLKATGWLVAGVGVHKVTEDLTAPLWDDVAHKIVDLCHAIEVWVSLLPPM
jgi:hypothetical protein